MVFVAIDSWCDMAHIYNSYIFLFSKQVGTSRLFAQNGSWLLMLLKQFYNIRRESAGRGRNSAKNATDSLATQRVPDLCTNPGWFVTVK